MGSVGDDAPPCRDEVGVFTPEKDERDVLAIMFFKCSSSPNKEFLPNEIPLVIFKCCVTVRARDDLPFAFGSVTRGGNDIDSDMGESLSSKIWDDERRRGGGGGGNLLVYSCRFRCCSAHTFLT